MKTNRKQVIQKWQDEAALTRFQMIAPLIEETLDHAKRVHLRHQIAEANGLSYKTIKRYDDAYQRDGFEGLKPKDHTPRKQSELPEDFEELLQQAIQLRREIPSRSVDKIITILEMEGRIAPGRLSDPPCRDICTQQDLGVHI